MILGREMILRLIRSRDLIVEPFSEDMVHGSGIDLRIGDRYAIVAPKETKIDTGNIAGTVSIHEYYTNDIIVVPPRQSILVMTLEYVRLPDDVCGLIMIKSTYARIGLLVPPTLVNAGFSGHIVVEVHNTNAEPVVLHVGRPLINMVLVKCDGCVPYCGHYQNQTTFKVRDRV